MKNKIIIAFLLVTTFGFTQEKVNIELKTIDELKVYNGLTVHLIKSTEQRLEITGKNAADVSVKNKKGVLKIAMNIASTFSSKYVHINLYYNSNIGELDVNQGSVIRSDEKFKQTQLKVSSQEGSYIKLEVAVDYLHIKGITGGNIQLKGNCKTQNVAIVSGANYEGFELKSEQATVYASTGGKAEIYVTEALEAKVKLGGTILYDGKPKSVSTTKVMGGNINDYAKGTQKKKEKTSYETKTPKKD